MTRIMKHTRFDGENNEHVSNEILLFYYPSSLLRLTNYIFVFQTNLSVQRWINNWTRSKFSYGKGQSSFRRGVNLARSLPKDKRDVCRSCVRIGES